MPETERDVVAAAAGMRMVFQPIVNLETGRVVGREALARFTDGRSPQVWIDAAHRRGLGIELELLALTRALDDVSPSSDGFVSLNLSPPVLLSPTLPGVLRERAATVQLVVELTEHTAIEDYPPLKHAIQGLRDMGVLVAVDDLGSGFASMRHVQRLRPDIVKLDRSLVASIDRDIVQHRLAQNLVDFAASIDCDVIAEGIERTEEHQVCSAIGIRLGQGYLFGRPVALTRPEAAVPDADAAPSPLPASGLRPWRRRR